jgi:hypothetical protein
MVFFGNVSNIDQRLGYFGLKIVRSPPDSVSTGDWECCTLVVVRDPMKSETAGRQRSELYAPE